MRRLEYVSLQPSFGPAHDDPLWSRESDDARPARAAATDAERACVSEDLLCVLEHTGHSLRGSQARHLAAIQGGRDAILVAATGSGKGATIFASAVARFVARLKAGDDLSRCEPVDLMLIPMTNMGAPFEEAFNTLVRDCIAGVPRKEGECAVIAGALYVDRGGGPDSDGGGGGGATTAATTVAAVRPPVGVCAMGHGLKHYTFRQKGGALPELHCDVCSAAVGAADGRWSCVPCDFDVCEACTRGSTVQPSSVEASPLPQSLPCGICAGCTGVVRSVVMQSRGCIFSCRVWPGSGGGGDGDVPWCQSHPCSACTTGSKRSLGHCLLRQHVQGRQTPSVPAAQAVATPPVATRGAEVEGGAVCGEEGVAAAPKQLGDLPATAPERRIANDSTLLLR